MERQVENAMNGTERLYQYCTSLESEAPLELPSSPSPWPTRGSIGMENVELRYRAELPSALKDFTLSITDGEITTYGNHWSHRRRKKFNDICALQTE